MRKMLVLLTLGSVLISVSSLLAVPPDPAGRCGGYLESRIVWCDDFDNYCVGGAVWPGYPPFPAKCPTDGTAVADNSAMLAQWPKVGTCGAGWGLKAAGVHRVNAPFSVEMEGYNAPCASQRMHDLTEAIQAADPTKSAINGTDENPLIFAHFMEFNEVGGAANSPFYLELNLNGDRAPTDYVMMDCSPETEGPWPIVCQQWLNAQTAALCPPLSAETHASIAFGVLAFLDTNPCDIGTGRAPSVWHGCFFDGLKWWDLRRNVFPGNGMDFEIPTWEGESDTWFYMEIKSTTVFVELTVYWDGSPIISNATIPRQYFGPFNHVYSGTGAGCELDPNTGECIGDYNSMPFTRWQHVYSDSPVLVDGELVSLEGACCKPDGTCEVVSEDVCVNTYGGTFAGIDTTCEDVLCCPMPFADADVDGDVDQSDFGAWQLCYTNIGGGVPAGCECFNRDDDNDVDGDDFMAFSACWSGAGIAADPNCE